ncbi:hypothetical protein SprV_0501911900 [Sparganum proliferum]
MTRPPTQLNRSSQVLSKLTRILSHLSVPISLWQVRSVPKKICGKPKHASRASYPTHERTRKHRPRMPRKFVTQNLSTPYPQGPLQNVHQCK